MSDDLLRGPWKALSLGGGWINKVVDKDGRTVCQLLTHDPVRDEHIAQVIATLPILLRQESDDAAAT